MFWRLNLFSFYAKMIQRTLCGRSTQQEPTAIVAPKNPQENVEQEMQKLGDVETVIDRNEVKPTDVSLEVSGDKLAIVEEQH